MLAALLLLKKPDLSEKAVDITSLTDMEADYFDVEKQGEGFGFHLGLTVHRSCLRCAGLCYRRENRK